MSVLMGQVTVPGNATVAAFTLPAGLANWTVFQQTQGSPAAVYVGTSTKVSSSNGKQVSVSPTNLDGYNTSGGVTYYATTGSSTASTLNYMISTGN